MTIRHRRSHADRGPIEIQNARSDFDLACAELSMAMAAVRIAQRRIIVARDHWIDVRDKHGVKKQ